TLADMVVVFDFRFGQRGAAGNTPVNGFLAPINKAPLDNVGEQAQFVRFVFFVQREVGIIPIAQDTESFELLALKVDVFTGISFAGSADCDGVKSDSLFCRRNVGGALGTPFGRRAGSADVNSRGSPG